MTMINLHTLLIISFIIIGIASAAEHIDYIDTAQVKAYGDMTNKQTQSIRNFEMTQSTSTGGFVLANFNAFMELTENIANEMHKDWQAIVSYDK